MKKSMIGVFGFLATVLSATTASADPVKVGGSVDLGVPDGLGIGVVVHPATSMLRLGLSFQENVVAPGGRASVVLTPFKWVVAPELEVDGGVFARETLPFAINGSKSLNLQYDYANFLVGVAFGNRNKAQFTISGGASYIAANLGGLSQSAHVSGFSIGNPSFDGFIPTGKLGVVFFF